MKNFSTYVIAWEEYCDFMSSHPAKTNFVQAYQPQKCWESPD